MYAVRKTLWHHAQSFASFAPLSHRWSSSRCSRLPSSTSSSSSSSPSLADWGRPSSSSTRSCGGRRFCSCLRTCRMTHSTYPARSSTLLLSTVKVRRRAIFFRHAEWRTEAWTDSKTQRPHWIVGIHTNIKQVSLRWALRPFSDIHRTTMATICPPYCLIWWGSRYGSCSRSATCRCPLVTQGLIIISIHTVRGLYFATTFSALFVAMLYSGVVLAVLLDCFPQLSLHYTQGCDG